MRNQAFILLALLLFTAAPVAAQMDFDQPHQIRIALGDIPTADGTQADGYWNVVETLRVDPADGDVLLLLPEGHVPIGAAVACDCEMQVNEQVGGRYTVIFTDNTTGEVTLSFSHRAPGAVPFTTTLRLLDEAAVIIYVPTDHVVEAPVTETGRLASPSKPGSDIVWFHAGAGGFPLTVQAPAPAAPGPAAGFDLLALALGIVAGAALWALLVQRGFVQKRSRKQIAGTSAHKQAAAREPRPVLEARKRALMAALKELEMAKMNKDIATDVYDVVKADLKRQTVTVMRAIEETPEA